jgi:hypothetical protein
MQCTVEREPRYAPCGFLIVPVGESMYDDTKTVFVQSDWDYPALASRLGFVCCDCGDTDGTVDCAHHTAGEMMTAAYDYLMDHLGEPFDGSEYYPERKLTA